MAETEERVNDLVAIRKQVSDVLAKLETLGRSQGQFLRDFKALEKERDDLLARSPMTDVEKNMDLEKKLVVIQKERDYLAAKLAMYEAGMPESLSLVYAANVMSGVMMYGEDSVEVKWLRRVAEIGEK